MTAADTAPLSGVRVVDLSWVLAGPVVGRLMADAGAEVIKVESRTRLDNTRRGRSLTPHDAGEHAAPDPIDRVPLFHNLNAGKKSIGVDLASAGGIDVVKRLIRRSHVVIENFAPGVMKRLGLGYDVLKAEHPSLIMVSLSGTGQDGPLSDVPAYAPTVTALAGLESIVGYSGEPPMGIMGLNLADSFAGMYGFHAVLNALWVQKRHGIGQHIDYSEMEGICTMMAAPFMDYHLNGRVMSPSGSDSPLGAPYGVFPTAVDDEWISIAVVGEDEWKAFCDATSYQPWCYREEFSSRYLRIRNKRELEDSIGEYTRLNVGKDMVAKLREAGIAAALVYGVAEQVADEHFWNRGLFKKIDVPGLGSHLIYGSPWRLTATPTVPSAGAPQLGEHTSEVLKEVLGMPESEIEALVVGGALQLPLSRAEVEAQASAGRAAARAAKD